MSADGDCLCHSAENTAHWLMEESAKARENGERCALDTALNVAATFPRRFQKSSERTLQPDELRQLPQAGPSGLVHA